MKMLTGVGLEDDSGDKDAAGRKKSKREDTSHPPESSNNFIPGSLGSGLPRTARLLKTLPHGDVVCAVAIHTAARRIYTGGKGSIKIWDLNKEGSKSPLNELHCLRNSYIRSLKLSSGNKTLSVAGETNEIVVWDLATPTPTMKMTIPTSASACYALAVNTEREDNCLYSCFSDGSVVAWDILTGKSFRSFVGHTGGVSCLDISPDGTKLLTGGLDSTVRIWDILNGKQISCLNFQSQVFSLAVCPGESWVAVGLENSLVEVMNLLNTTSKYQMYMHESCVLSVKFANNGKWFLSTGRDKQLACWRSPFGSSLFQCLEPNSVLCCDISADDNFYVTGSGDKLASVYEVIY